MQMIDNLLSDNSHVVSFNHGGFGGTTTQEISDNSPITYSSTIFDSGYRVLKHVPLGGLQKLSHIKEPTQFAFIKMGRVVIVTI